MSSVIQTVKAWFGLKRSAPKDDEENKLPNTKRPRLSKKEDDEPKRAKKLHKAVEPGAVALLTSCGMAPEVMSSGKFLVWVMSPEEEAYRNICTYIENSQGSYRLEVQNIFKLARLVDVVKGQERFHERYTTHPRCMLWHGTPNRHVPGILEHGLKVGEAIGYFGKGIYFADRIEKCIMYCKKESWSGSSCILFLCDVFLGKMHPCLQPSFKDPPLNFDCSMGVGKYIPNENGNKIFDDCVWPLGKTILNIRYPANQYYETLTEYCVSDPTRVCLKYLVKVKINWWGVPV